MTPAITHNNDNALNVQSPSCEVAIASAGDAVQTKTAMLDRSNFFSKHINHRINSFVQKRPLLAVVAGIGMVLASIAIVAIAGAVPAFALPALVIPVSLGCLLIGLSLVLKGLKSGPVEIGQPKLVSVEKPVSAREALEHAVNKAFDKLPTLLATELGKLPAITPELAARYNTTEDQLLTELTQAANMVVVHSVLQSVKSAADCYWDRNSRKQDAAVINAEASQAIKNKLRHYQDKDNLSNWVSKAVLPGEQNTVGVSQKEYFALHRIADHFIQQCLPARKPGESQEDHETASADEKKIAGRSGAERKDAFIKARNAMQHAMESLYLAFDKQVRTPGKSDVDMNRVNALTGQLPGVGQTSSNGTAVLAKPNELENQASQWLATQLKDFSESLSKAFDDFPEDIRDSYRNVMLRYHLQHVGSLSSVSAREEHAYTAALETLMQKRQQNCEKNSVDHDMLEGHMKNGLGALRQIIEHNRFADFLEAIDDRRVGTPWHDQRLNKHVEANAGTAMLENLRPEHRNAALQALAAYGDKAIGLWKGNGLTLHSHEKFKGLSDKKQNTETEGKKVHAWEKPNNTIHYDARSGNCLSFSMGVSEQFENNSLSSRFRPQENKVFINDLHTIDATNVTAHELGHALDHAMAAQLPNPNSAIKRGLISDHQVAILAEHEKAKENDTGITEYAQKNVHEHFAESAAAFLEIPGYLSSTYAEPVPIPGKRKAGSTRAERPTIFFSRGIFPKAQIFSRANLQHKHPLTAKFIDEALREPTKAMRAAHSLTDTE